MKRRQQKTEARILELKQLDLIAEHFNRQTTLNGLFVLGLWVVGISAYVSVLFNVIASIGSLK